jgi:hypothetical protein
MICIPALLSVDIVEYLELFECVVGGVLICFCFHVFADVSLWPTEIMGFDHLCLVP